MWNIYHTKNRSMTRASLPTAKFSEVFKKDNDGDIKAGEVRLCSIMDTLLCGWFPTGSLTASLLQPYCV